MGTSHAFDADVIQYFAFAVLMASADTGGVRPVQDVSVYTNGSMIQVNNSSGGIIPVNYSRRINPHDRQPLAPDRWFGEDKFKHFAFSYMITVGAFAGARFITGQEESIMIGAGLGLAAGIAKELYDRRTNRSASMRDLLWDAAGVATGIIIASHTR